MKSVGGWGEGGITSLAVKTLRRPGALVNIVSASTKRKFEC